MKNNIYIVAFLTVSSLFFTSCDYIIKSPKDNAAKAQSVANDKLEAELLLKATQQNLNAIALCEVVEKNNTDDSIRNAAKQIKNEQIAIFKSLQTIAKENLILVANTPKNTTYASLVKQNDWVDKELFVDQIQDNLDVQKEVLDSLISESDDKSILQVAQENIEKLKNNIEITEFTLESLK